MMEGSRRRMNAHIDASADGLQHLRDGRVVEVSLQRAEAGAGIADGAGRGRGSGSGTGRDVMWMTVV
jgi:hypothetical protein